MCVSMRSFKLFLLPLVSALFFTACNQESTPAGKSSIESNSSSTNKSASAAPAASTGKSEAIAPNTSGGANDQVAVIKTSEGTMVVEFWPDVAPKTVENFKKLANQGFYNGT